MPRCIDAHGCFAAALLLAAAGAWAFEDGAPAGHTGGFGEPDCSACHSDYAPNPPEGRLEVRGWPERPVAGKSYRLILVLAHPELASGGFQLTVRTPEGAPAGELRPLTENTRVLSEDGTSYLQHAHPERATGGCIDWELEWTAESSGAAVLNAAANAANDDFSALGDYVLTLEKRPDSAPDAGEESSPADH